MPGSPTPSRCRWRKLSGEMAPVLTARQFLSQKHTLSAIFNFRLRSMAVTGSGLDSQYGTSPLTGHSLILCGEQSNALAGAAAECFDRAYDPCLPRRMLQV